jgi:hypothetical protein
MFKRTLSEEVNDFLAHKEFIEMSKLRKMRNELLMKSDWTQLPDSKVCSPKEWLIYRQDLRDFPDLIYKQELETGIRVENLDWPKEPRIKK